VGGVGASLLGGTLLPKVLPGEGSLRVGLNLLKKLESVLNKSTNLIITNVLKIIGNTIDENVFNAFSSPEIPKIINNNTAKAIHAIIK